MMIDPSAGDTLVAMPSDLTRMLGARLKRERKKRILNQTEAAKLASVSQTRWSQLERGDASLEALIEAFTALGIRVGLTFSTDD